MQARHGKVFRLEDHMARFLESAKILGIPLALEVAQVQELIAELLSANDLLAAPARLRLTATPGDIHQAAQDPQATPAVTLLITAMPLSPYPETLYEKGMTVLVGAAKQNPQNPLTGHKTTSYFDRLWALRQAQALGAGEALWFTPRHETLAEGCISNVFLVDDSKTLLTPPLTLPLQASGTDAAESPPPSSARLCLPGMTRKVVLELAAQHGQVFREVLITIDDLLSAREIFLTNAIMGVMPVTRLERHAVGDEKPGEVTKKLAQLYAARVEEECRG
jgi:branched-chain amino acid aminotransferase